MEWRAFLLTCCCIATAVQARPKSSPQSSGCSLACTGRNFWTGYAAGNTYEYEFSHQIEISSDQSQQRLTALKAAGTAKVEVRGICEMLLTMELSTAQVSKSADEPDTMQDRTVSEAVKLALKAPLRFSYDNGRIVDLCPGVAETRASLNMKRSILSQLHVAIEDRRHEISLVETDVLGDCWTTYKSLGGDKLEKTKDLSTCSGNYEVFPRKGVKLQGLNNQRQDQSSVVNGKVRCTIERDSTSDIVKKSECQESRIVANSAGDGSKGEKVEVQTQLTFKKEIGDISPGLEEVTERTDLRHQHKTSAECQDSEDLGEENLFNNGNECLEKKLPSAGNSAANFKDAAKEAADQLCVATAGGDFKGDVAGKFVEVLKFVRGIDDKAIMKQLTDGASDCAKNFLYEAIASAGTPASVDFIIEALKSGTGAQEKMLTNAIFQIAHPTADIVEKILSFVQSEEAEFLFSFPSKLALSAVAGRYCDENPDCEDEKVIKDVMTFLNQDLGDKCSKLENSETSVGLQSLQATGNLGRIVGGAKTLIDCANNDKLNLAHRVFAVRALRRFRSLQMEQKMQLTSIVMSNSSDSELRIAAYLMVIKHADREFRNNEQVISQLSDLFMDINQDHQVQMFIYSHLKQALENRKSFTDDVAIASIVREFGQTLGKTPNQFGFSKAWRTQFNLENMKSKVDLESDVIYSSKSMFPRFINLNFTVESPLSGESINMFEYGLRLEGMESLIESFYGTMGQAGKRLRRRRRQAKLTEDQKKFSQQVSKSRIDFFSRTYGMETKIVTVDHDFLTAVSGIVGESLSDMKGALKESLSNLNSVSKSPTTAGTLLESTISVPTIAGFPILLKKEFHYVMSLNTSMDVTDEKFEMQIKPTVAAYISRVVSVDSPYERTGVNTRTSVLSSTGVKIETKQRFKKLSDMDLSFKITPIQQTQRIVDLKTEIMFFNHDGSQKLQETRGTDETKPVKKCSSDIWMKAFGRRVCMESTFKSVPGALSGFPQGPGVYRMFIERNAMAGGFELSLKNQWTKETKEFLLLIGDQQVEGAHFKLGLSKSGGEANFELIIPIVPIKLKFNKGNADGGSKKSTVTSTLLVGSAAYNFNGEMSKVASKDGKDWRVSGEFSDSNSPSKKIEVMTQFNSYGLLMDAVPMNKFDVELKNGDTKLSLNYLFRVKSGNLDWKVFGMHEQGGSPVTNIKWSITGKTDKEGKKKSRSFVHLLEVLNRDGRTMLHTFQVKADRSKKGDNQMGNSAQIIHSFEYDETVGVRRTMLTFNADLQLQETRSKGSYDMTGSGQIKFGSGTPSEEAKIKDLTISIGKAKDAIDGTMAYDDMMAYDGDGTYDGIKGVKGLKLGCGLEYRGSQSNINIGVQVLPARKWSPNRQFFDFSIEQSNTATGEPVITTGVQLLHVVNGKGSGDIVNQVVKVEYYDKVYVDFSHSLAAGEEKGKSYQHKMSLASHAGNIFNISGTYIFAKPTYEATISLDVRDKKYVHASHKLVIGAKNRYFPQKLEHEVNLYQKPSFSYSSSLEFNEAAANNGEAIVKLLSQASKDNFSPKRLLQLMDRFFSDFSAKLRLEGNSAVLQRKFLNELTINKMDGVVFNANFTKQSYPPTDVTEPISQWIVALTAKPLPMTGNNFHVKVTGESTNQNWRISTESELRALNNGKMYKFNTTVRVNPKSGAESITELSGSVALPKGNAEEITVDFSFDGKRAGVNEVLATYALNYQKNNKGSIMPIDLSSDLKMKRSPGTTRFEDFSSNLKLGPSADEKISMYFNNTLDNTDIFSMSGEFSKRNIQISATSQKLQIKTLSLTANIEKWTDNVMKYLLDVNWDIRDSTGQCKQVGELKYSANKNDILFSLDFNGDTELKGLQSLGVGDTKLNSLFNQIIKTNGELDFKLQLANVVDGKNDVWLLIDIPSKLWPLNVAGKLKTRLMNIGNFGFQIFVGPKRKTGNFAMEFVAEYKENKAEFNYEHELSSSDETKSINTDFLLKSDWLIPEFEGIKGNFTLSGSHVRNYKLQAVVRTLSSSAQLIEYQQSDNGTVIDIQLDHQRNNVKTTLFKLFNVMKFEGEQGQGKLSVMIKGPGSPEPTRVSYESDLLYGNDMLIALKVGFNDEEVFRGQLFQLQYGKTYPQLEILPVKNANLGVRILHNGYEFYIIKSATSSSAAEWNAKLQMPEKPEAAVANLQMEGGQLKSGTATVLGKTLTFESKSGGALELTAKSDDGTYSVTLTQQDNAVDMKFKNQNGESCLKVARQPGNIVMEHGKCSSLSVLTITYKSDDLKQLAGEISVEHQMPADAANDFNLLPTYTPDISWLKPFSFSWKSSDNLRVTDLNLNWDSDDLVLTHSTDSSNFPQSTSFNFHLKPRRIAPYNVDLNLSFDLPTKNFTVRASLYFSKIIVQPKYVLIDVAGIYGEGKYVWLPVDDQTNMKNVNRIELKGNYRNTRGSNHKLLLWNSKDSEGVWQYGMEFTRIDAKSLTITAGLDSTESTKDIISFKTKINLQSDLAYGMNSIKGENYLYIRKPDLENNVPYTIQYNETIIRNGGILFSFRAYSSGDKWLVPNSIKLEAPEGRVIGNFNYDAFTNGTGFSIAGELRKFLSNSNKFSFGLETLTHSNNLPANFKVHFESSKRQLLLGMKSEEKESGASESVLSIFVDKKREEGIAITFGKNMKVESEFKRWIKVMLPTRIIGYDLTGQYTGDKRSYDLKVYWDGDTKRDSQILLNFWYEATQSVEGFYFIQSSTLDAPFLKNKLTKSIAFHQKDDAISIRANASIDTVDDIKLSVDWKRFWSEKKQAVQRNLTATFTQSKGNFKANFDVSVDAESLSGSKRYSPWKYLTVYKIYFNIPSKSIDTYMRIRTVPYEEFSLATKNGATFSYRYREEPKKSRISFFASNSEKEAGQLMIVRSKEHPNVKVTLDTGRGYVDPDSRYSIPSYAVEKLLVRASAGLSKCGTKLHIGGIYGAGGVSSSMSLWKPEEIPKDFGFFFAGLKLNKDSKVIYESHWRMPKTQKRPLSYMKEILVDSWTKAYYNSGSMGAIKEMFNNILQLHQENLDSQYLLKFLNDFSSRDFDILKRRLDVAYRNNEFHVQTFVRVMRLAYKIWFDAYQKQMNDFYSSISKSLYMPKFDVVKFIGSKADYIVDSLNKIPIDKAWRRIVEESRAAYDRASSKLSSIINSIDISAPQSLIDMRDNLASSRIGFYPMWLIQEFGDMAEEMLNALTIASEELMQELQKMLEPYSVNMGLQIYSQGEKFVKDFANFQAQFKRQWQELMRESDTPVGNPSDIEWASSLGADPSMEFAMANTIKSFRTFLAGDYSESVKQFFNTEANQVDVWRLDCDQNCVDSGSFAAVNGTMYVPFMPQTLRPDTGNSESAFYEFPLMKLFRPMQSDVMELLKSSSATIFANQVKTFDGETFQITKPCTYLMAHDFRRSKFSIFQSFVSAEGGITRGDLVIQISKLKVTITPQGEVQVDGNKEELPMTKKLSDTQGKVKATKVNEEVFVVVQDGGLDILKLRCGSQSCKVQVNGMYRTRINGALGSNDGYSRNDVKNLDSKEHEQLWTSGECKA